jgi:hypothetical protein
MKLSTDITIQVSYFLVGILLILASLIIYLVSMLKITEKKNNETKEISIKDN